MERPAPQIDAVRVPPSAEDVAVDEDLPLAEDGHVDHGPERAADESLDLWVRPDGRPS